ncbi:MAG: hypothetical protein MI923_27075, partial [Phycisphaerales bacterium]|nr:hypothetical protein [Phycisphaerales bacterium]
QVFFCHGEVGMAENNSIVSELAEQDLETVQGVNWSGVADRSAIKKTGGKVMGHEQNNTNPLTPAEINSFNLISKMATTITVLSDAVDFIVEVPVGPDEKHLSKELINCINCCEKVTHFPIANLIENLTPTPLAPFTYRIDDAMNGLLFLADGVAKNGYRIDDTFRAIHFAGVAAREMVSATQEALDLSDKLQRLMPTPTPGHTIESEAIGQA